MNETRKFIVTGGAGFVGSNIVDRLLADGHDVIVYDNFCTGQEEFLSEAKNNSRFSVVKGDVLDREAFEKASKGCDVVFHMAANADIRQGLENPKRDIEQNTIATFNVLEAMRANDIEIILFASSAAALGEPDTFPTPETCSTPIQTSLYGASKMACEGLISAYCEGYGMESYIFRFVSLLGPRYPHGHVIDFYKMLRDDPSKLRVLGDGTQRKSYLHIHDCVNAIMHVLETRTAKDVKHRTQIYNLGFPDFIELNHSVKVISEHMKLTPRIDYTGGRQGWVGDNPFVFLDVAKIRATGWEPNYSIDEAIKSTVDWLSQNEWILEKR